MRGSTRRAGSSGGRPEMVEKVAGPDVGGAGVPAPGVCGAVPVGGAGGDCISIAATSVTAGSGAITGSRYARGRDRASANPEAPRARHAMPGPRERFQAALGVSRQSRGPRRRA